MIDIHLYYLDEPLLREKTVPIDDVNDELLGLAEKMRELMQTIKGVGLAANQIGRTERFFVLHHSILPPGSDTAFYNPEIIEYSAEVYRDEEGCLSLLSIYADVTRPIAVTLEYTDDEGNRKLMEAEGLLARAIQHEIDHLDGVLFIDHLSRLKRKMVIQKYRRKHQDLVDEDKLP